MPRPQLPLLSATEVASPADYLTQVKLLYTELERQLKENALTTVSYNKKAIEKNLRAGDPVFQYLDGRLRVGVWNGKAVRWLNGDDLQLLQNRGTNFTGIHQGTLAVTAPAVLTDFFPNEWDWGLYHRTSTGVLYT